MSADKLVEDLGRFLGDEAQVLAPGAAGYDSARRVFNRMHDVHPRAIVRPSSNDRVADIVGMARERNVDLAVRGGGHHIGGFGTIAGGFVLDFGELRAVDPHPDGSVDVAGADLLVDPTDVPYVLEVDPEPDATHDPDLAPLFSGAIADLLIRTASTEWKGSA